VTALIVLLVGLFSAPPAWAHGGDQSKEGYLLVQQALGHLAHDTSAVGITLALAKVDDALAAVDQEGVAVDQVRQARSALENAQPEQARSLLQSSIAKALAQLQPATGEMTGTKVIDQAAPGRSGSLSHSWGALVLSALLLVSGLVLARLFRPVDSVRALRRRLAPTGPTPPRHLLQPIRTKDAR
jgi:hypothetical protein